MEAGGGVKLLLESGVFQLVVVPDWDVGSVRMLSSVFFLRPLFQKCVLECSWVDP